MGRFDAYAKEGMVFPKNPKDLLPNALRDKKGYIYASDHILVLPESENL